MHFDVGCFYEPWAARIAYDLGHRQGVDILDPNILQKCLAELLLWRCVKFSDLPRKFKLFLPGPTPLLVQAF